MNRDEIIAKHDSQILAIHQMLSRIDSTTKQTHSIVKATSVVGPAHRANLFLSIIALGLSVTALGTHLTGCVP